MLASAARAALRASVAAATRSAWPQSTPVATTPHACVRPLVPSFAAAAFTRFASSSASTAAAKAAGLKAYRPTTPGFRGRIITARDGLWSGRPHKPLTVGLRRTGGRNSTGRVTVRHRGGGHRKVYRVIDFWRRDGGGGGEGGADGAQPRTARVERIEYDPNRTARIALLASEAAGDTAFDPATTSTDGRSYILAPAGLVVGDTVASGAGAPVTPGCCLRLADIPVGTPVHNVELLPGKGGQMARAAGTAAVVVSRGGPDGYAIVRLPSGAQRRVLASCRATVGSLSNPGHKNRSLGKAGAARWAGRRPKVRGVAMNSVDHPMGGGRGKSKGRISQSPTGVPAKGKKTRAARNRTDVFVHVPRPRARRKNQPFCFSHRNARPPAAALARGVMTGDATGSTPARRRCRQMVAAMNATHTAASATALPTTAVVEVRRPYTRGLGRSGAGAGALGGVVGGGAAVGGGLGGAGVVVGDGGGGTVVGGGGGGATDGRHSPVSVNNNAEQMPS